ncbi:hypothetical protein [Desulfogranum japonicum]|uniref:hypothetical protein n=1 Tax=Desulfogranum japonicum TaxID=231447 RepID=UPI0003FA3CAB|nr:hypothetical protein [Desulfogranum japonicum]
MHMLHGSYSSMHSQFLIFSALSFAEESEQASNSYGPHRARILHKPIQITDTLTSLIDSQRFS